VKTLLLILVLVCPLVVGLSASQQKARRQPNGPPVIDSFTSSKKAIFVCEFARDAYRSEVDLFVNATDPDGDKLLFKYSTTDGTISGKGNLVVWNLRDVKRGPHEVRVTVTDGRGGRVHAALTVITADSGTCDPPRVEPCPEIKVSCPDEMDKAGPFKFSANIKVNGKTFNTTNLRWTLNAGRIIKGQNGREIEVSTTGANGFEKITATVEVSVPDPSCIRTASCSTKIIW
jgi:Big-like domain-containing protein